MNGLTSSRSVLSRLGRLLLHRYKPAQPLQTPRYTHQIQTAVRGLQADVLDSIRGLFSRHVKSFIAYRTPLPPLPAASRSRLPTPSRRWYRDPRKVAAAVLLTCAVPFAALGALSHEETVPYTNRIHWVMISPSDERERGDFEFFNDIKELGDKVLGSSDPDTARIHLIASNIIHGVHRAFPTKIASDGNGDTSSYNAVNSATDDMLVTKSRKQGKATVQPQTGHLHDLDWEVIVARDDRVGAYSYAGSKILVYTGCLNYFKTDDEIATLIAHEVGHVVARHSAEFKKIITLIPALNKLLPFSRWRELEADLIGMMLLAAAGYDPRVAPSVYQKLGEISGNSAWKDYIGTHPSGKKRSHLLSQGKVMEKALELYDKQICAGEGSDRHISYSGRFWETNISQ